MKHLPCLLVKEIRSLLFAPSTYAASALFMMIMGIIYWLILLEYSQEAIDSLPIIDFFKGYWLPVLILVPMLTMRCIAEERRQKTLETLLTTPASALEVVVSKFLAAYLLYCGLWMLTLCYPIITSYIVYSNLDFNPFMDRGILLGGYLFIGLSGLLFVSIGILASSLTRSQLVAGMLCFTILFIIIVGGFLIARTPISQNSIIPIIELPMEYALQSFIHLEDFSRGVIDTRPFSFYISNTLLALGVSVLVVESKIQ